MTLAELEQGKKGVITRVKGHGAFRKRITEMGFVKGKTVTVIRNAPLKDPVEYNIMDYQVSLRRSEASMIEVIPIDDGAPADVPGIPYPETVRETVTGNGNNGRKKIIDVALVGNPNSGKTSVFNYATRSREHVGNYGGVTIDSKQARITIDDYVINIIDLPGTYSLTAYSPEELYVRKYIFGHQPDVVVNVLDASNLERNLYLTTQLIDMDVKVVVALNMFDEMSGKGDKFNHEYLGRMMGIPMVPTVATRGKGIGDLFRKVIDVVEGRDNTVRNININYGKNVESAIEKIQELIQKNKGLSDRISARFYAIKLLEKDNGVHFTLSRTDNYEEIEEEVENQIEELEGLFNDDSETLITDARYGFIAGALKETYTPNKQKRKLKTDTEIIDTFITHKIFGFPIFLFFLWITFQATFNLGQYPQAWIEAGMESLGRYVTGVMPVSIARDLLVNGIIDGVGGVLVFLPNILILFLFISFMEDTGYMARAAFIMDKLMHKVGLHGKSFIPLIMGFGCNVPAIMATRTLENRNDRLLTILINPFMSCSARLPVYILIISAFFPGMEVTIIFLIYAIGIAFAVIMALIFKKTLFRSDEAPFVMELPPYRLPTAKVIFNHMWFKSSQYVKKIGGVIMIASVIIWALGYFPIQSQEAKNLEDGSAVSGPMTDNQDMKEKDIQESYIASIGHFIQPVMAPLGFDWKMTVSLLGGVAAKEVVVSTLAVLYQPDDQSGEVTVGLTEKLRKAKYTDGEKKGEPVFNKVVAFAYLMFILLYFPCIGVVSTVRKETGKWKWAFFMIFYTTALAWIAAFVVNQVGSLLV
mgnify:CR=1 FL=1